MYLKRILTYSILALTALSGFFGVHIENNTQNTQPIPFQVSIIDTTYAESADAAYEASQRANAGKEDPTSKKTIDKYNGMIDTLNIALAVLSAMVSPIILFVGWLISPDWTSGDLFGLRTPMYNLWVTVSNIVYFIYAILLILIALGTMFNQDKFSYKVMLPKLALGILMVPFTWWFVQWTVSIASVVTASVMTIPMETMKAIEAKSPSPWFSQTASIPKEVTIGSGATKTPECPTNCITPQKFLEGSAGIYGPLVVYGYSIFKFQKITHLDGPDIATAALSIVHTSIVSTIMFAVFGLLVLALGAMLFIRAVKLWMYAIFAPLFTFRFVAGSNLMGGDDDSFSIKEFMGLAFVPAIVGLTLSFGLIMIAAVHSTNGDGAGATKTEKCDLLKGCNVTIMGAPENSIFRKWEKDKDGYKTTTTFTWGEFKVNFLGSATNQKNTSSSTQGTIDAAGGMFGTIIIDVISLIFIWMAFMAAKNVSKAVKAAVQPFEDIGNKIGGLAKSMPKYTPLPIPGGSIAGMNKATADIAHIPEKAAADRYDKSDTGKFLRGLSGGLTATDADKIATALKETNIKDALGKTKSEYNTVRAAGRGEGLASDSNMENLNNLAKRVQNDKNAEQSLKDVYGTKAGEELYKRLKDGKIDNKDEAKIVAAMLANNDTNAKKVENAIDAEKHLKNETPTPSSSGTSAITLNINAADKGDASKVAKALEGIGKEKATTQEIKDLLTKEGIADAIAKEAMDKLPKDFAKK